MIVLGQVCVLNQSFSRSFVNFLEIATIVRKRIRFHFSLKYEVSISIGRLSGGHFAQSMSRSSWDQNNFGIDGRPLWSFILMSLIFPRAP